jgi:mRNA interferase MazF
MQISASHSLCTWNIVLIPFPHTVLTQARLRPALVIFEGKRDFIVAFITSRTQGIHPELDVLISMEDPEFDKTGLKATSVLKR